MIKRYLPFTIQVFRLNIALSPVIAFFAAILSIKFFETPLTLDRFMYLFLLCFTTGGFLIGVLFFEFTRHKEYYFYYNFGISKIKLISVSYLFHLGFAALILILSLNV